MSSQNKFTVIIPARYASTRLPQKLLLDLNGKPVLQHVYEKALQSSASEILIATDDTRILELAQNFGANAYLTSSKHCCGTERIVELLLEQKVISNDIVVNVQGDEPFIAPQVINQVAKNLSQHSEASIATLYEPINNIEDIFNPNVVKVVCDRKGYALYFSRASIPWYRESFKNYQKHDGIDEDKIKSILLSNMYFKHLGIYAYRRKFLEDYNHLSIAPLEQLESLEQLRALWYGYKIHVAKAECCGMIGIDTLEDLEKARNIFDKK